MHDPNALGRASETVTQIVRRGGVPTENWRLGPLVRG
jgi:hypothetical protein